MSVIDLEISYIILYCFFFTLLYVGSLYVSSRDLHRSSTQVIQKRSAGVSIACLISISIIQFRFVDHFDPDIMGIRLFFGPFDFETNQSADMAPTWLFLSNDVVMKCVNTVVYTCAAVIIPTCQAVALFLGPLICQGLPRSDYDDDNLEGSKWIFLRNYIIAPITEEVMFRACIVTLLISKLSPLQSIILSPAFFGVAHFHHAMERIIADKMPVGETLLVCSFQFLYTGIFGAYSAFVFLRTGNLLSCIVVHALCNRIGFPDLSVFLSHSFSPISRIWSFLLYLLGLILWLLLLFPLSDPTLYQNQVYGSLWK